jgi:hypothetical protein
MRKADSCLVAGVLLAAALSAMIYYRVTLLRTDTAVDPRAVIKVRGRIVRTIDLFKDGKQAVYQVQGLIGSALVELDGNRVRMREAPCPDRTCILQGWIERPGESIVCLPNLVEIRIEGGSGLDAVTR